MCVKLDSWRATRPNVFPLFGIVMFFVAALYADISLKVAFGAHSPPGEQLCVAELLVTVTRHCFCFPYSELLRCCYRSNHCFVMTPTAAEGFRISDATSTFDIHVVGLTPGMWLQLAFRVIDEEVHGSNFDQYEKT